MGPHVHIATVLVVVVVAMDDSLMPRNEELVEHGQQLTHDQYEGEEADELRIPIILTIIVIVIVIVMMTYHESRELTMSPDDS